MRQIERFTKQEITRIPVPKAEDIEKHREDRLLEQMVVRLKSGDYQKELQIVARLGEKGYDAQQIAATALKIARGQDTDRPIAPISEVDEGRKQKPKTENKHGKKENSRGGSHTSHEAGMVRMTLNAGKSQGIVPADVVGTIARYAGFPGSAIGAIKILETHTLVDIPQQYVTQTLVKAGKIRIRKNAVTLKLPK